jgi:hypothetical protein
MAFTTTKLIINIKKNHVICNQPTCNWMQLLVACNYIWILDDFQSPFYLWCNWFFFHLSKWMALHFDYMLLYIWYHIYILFYANKFTKELELQKSIWFSFFKPNNDPFHFKITYFSYFKTSLNDFCGFECVKCRILKSF